MRETQPSNEPAETRTRFRAGWRWSRRALAAIAWLVVGLAAAPCAAMAADPVIVRLQWDHQFQFAGYYAALWKGFYAEAGLDVTLLPGVAAGGVILNTIDEVVAGRADFGVAAGNLLVARDQGKPVVVVAPIFQQSAVAVFARFGTDLSSPADLLKARMFLYPGSLTTVEVEAMMRAEGLDPSPIPRSTDFSLFGPDAVRDGKVDAFAGYSLDVLWRAGRMGLDLRRLRPSTYGVDFYGDTLFTHEDIARRNPDLVRRFRDATLHGWSYALQHPEEIAERIVNDLPRILPVDDPLGFNLAQADQIARLMFFPTVPVGQNEATRWRGMHRALTESGLVTHPFDPAAFLFDDGHARQQEFERAVRIAVAAAAVSALLLVIAAGINLLVRRQVVARTAELRASEQREREVSRRLELVIGATRDGVWDWNVGTGEIFISPVFRDLTGCPYHASVIPAAFIQGFMDWFRGSLHPDDAARLMSGGVPALPAGDHILSEFRLRTGSKGYRWFLARGTVLRDAAGRPVRAVGVMSDVTERREVDEALRFSEMNLRQAQSTAKIGSWATDPNLGTSFWSDEMQRLLQTSPAEFAPSQEAFLAFVHPADRDRVAAALSGFSAEAAPIQLIHKLLLRDGSIKVVEVRGASGPSPHGPLLLRRGTMQDVTERAAAENALRIALHEKETLLREVHHRVKNNLQVVSSLLYFYEARAKSAPDRAALAEVRGRLRAMILVHERLYRSRDLARVNLAEYIGALAADQAALSGADYSRIALVIGEGEIYLPIETALPCGMIVSELLTNAFKHAFAGDRAGTVAIDFARNSDTISISIADNGPGMPDGFDPRDTDTFGWQLIVNLIEQIGGSIQVSGPGTRVTFTFPEGRRPGP